MLTAIMAAAAAQAQAQAAQLAAITVQFNAEQFPELKEPRKLEQWILRVQLILNKYPGLPKDMMAQQVLSRLMNQPRFEAIAERLLRENLPDWDACAVRLRQLLLPAVYDLETKSRFVYGAPQPEGKPMADHIGDFLELMATSGFDPAQYAPGGPRADAHFHEQMLSLAKIVFISSLHNRKMQRDLLKDRSPTWEAFIERAAEMGLEPISRRGGDHQQHQQRGGRDQNAPHNHKKHKNGKYRVFSGAPGGGAHQGAQGGAARGAGGAGEATGKSASGATYCFTCKGHGHMSRDCPTGKAKGMHHLTVDSVPVPTESAEQVDYSIVLQAKIGGHPARVLVDCGAVHSALSPQFVNRHNIATSQGRVLRGKSWTGEVLETSSYATALTFSSGTFVERLDFPVMATPDGYDCVLGARMMAQHHVVVNVGSGRVSTPTAVLQERRDGKGSDVDKPAPQPIMALVPRQGNPTGESATPAVPDPGASKTRGASAAEVDGASASAVGTAGATASASVAGAVSASVADTEAERPTAVAAADACAMVSVTDGADRQSCESLLISQSEVEAAMTRGEVEGVFPLGFHLSRVIPQMSTLGDAVDAGSDTAGAALSEARLHLTRVLETKFTDILAEQLEKLPPLRDVNFRMTLRPGATPKPQPVYRLSMEDTRALMEIVNRMLKAGLISPCTSPYAVPAFVVPKRSADGTRKYRMVQDWRQRNAETELQAFPMPRIDDMLVRMAHVRVMSTFDFTEAFYQIRVEPGHERLTAFSTPQGTYAMHVVPMGHVNSAAVLMHAFYSIFHDFITEGWLFIYVDDVLIGSATIEEHKAHVERFLWRCREHKLFLKPSKVNLVVTETVFLGHKVGNGCVSPPQDRVEAIEKWPTPQNKTAVRSFLGATNFYRLFINHYATIAAPLHDISGAGDFTWTEAQEQSFAALKRALITAPVLRLPDLSGIPHFDIRTDASKYGVGGVVEQDGHPVAFFSRSLRPNEKNWPVRELELLALVCILEQFRHWFGGATLTAFVDHESLQYFTTCKVTKRLVRHLETLQEFDLTIRYVKGATNVVADALSRKSDLLADDDKRETTQRFHTVFRRLLDTTDDETNAGVLAAFRSTTSTAATTTTTATTTTQITTSPTLLNLLLDGYKVDKTFGAIYTALQGTSDATAAPHLRLALPYYYLSDAGLLYRRNATGPDRICVPTGDARNLLLHIYHDDQMHMGINKTASSLALAFYWPSMKQDIRRYIAGCESCLRAKPSHRPQQGLTMPLTAPARPWLDLTMDLLSGLPEADGYNCLLVVVDRHSKGVVLAPTTTTATSEDIADLLLQHVYAHYGAFRSLTSDRGSVFTSAIFNQVMARLGVDLHYTTAGTPSSDGQSEVYMRVIAASLRANLESESDPWPQLLPFVAVALNSTVHASTGHTPFFVNTLREPLMFTDLVNETILALDHRDADVRAAVDVLVHDAITQAQQRFAVYHDAKREAPREYRVGEPVLVKSTALMTPEERDLFPHRKLQARWVGPFPIAGKISANAYRLDLPPRMRAHHTVNVNSLKPYTATGTFGRAYRPPPVLHSDDGEFYMPAAIVGHRDNPDGSASTQYRVRWLGYSPDQDSWVTEADLTLCQPLLDAYRGAQTSTTTTAPKPHKTKALKPKAARRGRSRK